MRTPFYAGVRLNPSGRSVTVQVIRDTRQQMIEALPRWGTAETIVVRLPVPTRPGSVLDGSIVERFRVTDL